MKATDAGIDATKNAPEGAFFVRPGNAYWAITRTISSTLFE